MNCTGHCCKRFFLSDDATDKLLHEPGRLVDGVQVQQMLLPTGEENYWTCVNYDSGASQCLIFDDRPNMCVSHPVGVCPYKGCTFSGEELKEHRLHTAAP